MSTNKPTSNAIAVPISVDLAKPGETAMHLFDALRPLICAIAHQYAAGPARDDFWGSAAGGFAGACAGSIGITKAADLLQQTADMVANEASKPSKRGRPN